MDKVLIENGTTKPFSEDSQWVAEDFNPCTRGIGGRMLGGKWAENFWDKNESD